MIKNIVFDFGGVIINIDERLMLKGLRDLGLAEMDQLAHNENLLTAWESFECGEYSREVFRDKVRDICGDKVSDEQINKALNAMILDIPQHRMALLQNIKSEYRIFLLSNTNAIHYDFYNQYVENKFGVVGGLHGVFEELYLSHEMGLRKPGADIFERVLQQSGIMAHETVFIDDTLANVEAAQRVGYHGIHLLRSNDVTALFENDRIIGL